MRVHFTFDEGKGVEFDGTHDFEDIDQAKREAMLALAQSLQEETRRDGDILGTVAGLDDEGNALFSVSMHVIID